MQKFCVMFVFMLPAANMLHAQNTYMPLGAYSYHLLDRMDIMLHDTLSIHTTNKPWLRNEVAASIIVNDSLWAAKTMTRNEAFNTWYLMNENSEFSNTGLAEKGKLLKYFYHEPDAFYSVKEKSFFLKLNPVLYNEFGSSSDTSELKFINSRGIELRGGIDEKVGFYFYATDNQAKLPDYVSDRVAQANNVLPGEGRVKPFKETGIDYLNARGYIGFNATKHIAVQFGQDKIFIGDGLRSLIWSDNAKDFLFLKLNTNVWKINYQNIFAGLANYDGSFVFDSLLEKKYAAMHHLNVKFSENFTFGLFESVIFDRIDSTGKNRGFDLNYLNPIIFYRAVESGLGSPDNVLLGANWKWNFLNRFSFYGQFVLDELLVGEFIKNTGWWGNKNALQLGLKYIDAFNIDYLDLHYEFNTVRPYTYAYEDNGSSFTHYNQAIAHPLGANFSEHIIRGWYQFAPKIVLQNTFINAVYGSDTAGSNWGGNIFANYLDYEQEYENHTGQGIKNSLLLNDLVISWQFWHNVFLEGRCIYRKNDAVLNQFDTDELFIGVGVRMNAGMRKDYY